MSSKKKEFEQNSLKNLKKIFGDKMGELIYERRKTSKIIPNPDTITFTSSSGEKEVKKWKLFDLELVRDEVESLIEIHNGYSFALNILPKEEKFNCWWDKMYDKEKTINNYKYLQIDYPQYRFDIKEIRGYEDYRPIFSDDILFTTNSHIDKYDSGEMTFKECMEYTKDYLFDLFPEDLKTTEEIASEQTQIQVDELLNKMANNYTYELNRDELAYQSNKDFKRRVGTWFDKRFKEFRVDKDTHFTRFEILCQNYPQPTYKLASIFNPQLAQMTMGDYNTREKSKEGRFHPYLLERLENRLIDWFTKKYATSDDQEDKDLFIDIVRIQGIKHIYTGKKELKLPNN